MMGGLGLTQATTIALLHANYIAKRLNKYYPILYTGQNNRVAHECIVDIRPIKKQTGINEEDKIDIAEIIVEDYWIFLILVDDSNILVNFQDVCIYYLSIN